MEQKRRLNPLWIVLGVLVVMLSTCLGAVAGGVAGYWVGRRASAQAVQSREGQLPQFWALPQQPQSRRRVQPAPGIEGALVISVTKDSPADAAGIRVGDVITAIGGESIGEENTPEVLIRKYQPGDKVEVTLWTRGSKHNVSVKLGTRPGQPGVPYLGITYILKPPVPESPTQ